MLNSFIQNDTLAYNMQILAYMLKSGLLKMARIDLWVYKISAKRKKQKQRGLTRAEFISLLYWDLSMQSEKKYFG